MCIKAHGVLSPVLLTIYIDDLEFDKGVGCFWNQHFVGAPMMSLSLFPLPRSV